MTNHSDYDDQCPSETSWVLVEPYSKNREPQYNGSNQSSVEQAAATSGAYASSPSGIASVHSSDIDIFEEGYDASKKLAPSLESACTDATDATLRPADNAETPSKPLIVQDPEPVAAPIMSPRQLGPQLLMLPQQTSRNYHGWAAGEENFFMPYAPAQDSIMVEPSTNDSNASSHSRAGMMHMDPQHLTVRCTGMWSGPVPDMRASMLTLSNTESNF